MNFYLSSIYRSFINPAKAFCRFISDMIIKKNKNVIVIGLTCCFERNFEKSRQYKIKRYEDLRNDCIIENTNLTEKIV